MSGTGKLPVFDLNSVGLGGHTRISRGKLKGQPKVGHVMQAYEISDGDVWLCYISSVSEVSVTVKPLGVHLE